MGAKRTPSNCLLEYVNRLPHSPRASRHVLHYVAECQEVWIRRGEESLENSNLKSFGGLLKVVSACLDETFSNDSFFLLLFFGIFLTIYSSCRESDRFFDEPFAESELNGGVDNHIGQSQPLRSRDNIYEYKDSPVKKSQSDFNSVRSPSSLGMTQMTQMTKVSSSQSSLKSAISLKESPTLPKVVPIEKYAEQEIDVKSDKSDKASVLSSSTATNSSIVKKDLLSNSPVPQPRFVHKPPSSNSSSVKTSRTIFDGNVPQTEV